MGDDFFNRTVQIAGYLRLHSDEDWKPHIPADGARDMAHICHPDGRRIYLEFSRGKIFVTGKYPTDDKHGSSLVGYFIPYGKKPPIITMSASRDDEGAAKAIINLFLPLYTPLWEKCQAVLQEEAKKNDIKAQRAELLCELIAMLKSPIGVNKEIEPPATDAKRYHKAAIRVNGETNSICIYDLSPAMFERVCQLLADETLPYIIN